MKKEKKIYEGELRCWICKRNAREVEEMIPDMNLAKDIICRNSLDLDNLGEKGNIIQLVNTPSSHHIPLCLICQGILLYQGVEAAIIHEENK